jgi:tetratricopeptide (TPR) repeat protein
MDTCSHYSDKIIFFEDLSPDEQQEVKDHTGYCDRCRKHLQQIQAIMASLDGKLDTHAVEDESLLRYSIHLSAPKESDYDGRKLARSEIASIRKHIGECESCRQKVDQFCQEIQEIEQYLEEAELPELVLSNNFDWAGIFEKARFSWNRAYRKAIGFLADITDLVKRQLFAPMPRLVPITIGVTALVVFVWAGPFFRDDDPYHQLASLRQQEILSLTRGSLPELLADGLSAFHEGNYERSIQDLERFISNNSTDPSLYHAHYVLGISYLFEAKSDFLGRFQKYDISMVDRVIQNLELARNLSDNSGVREDCLWHMAKAYLMKRDGERARAIYENILSFQGRRFKEARQEIEEIDDLLGYN